MALPPDAAATRLPSGAYAIAAAVLGSRVEIVSSSRFVPTSQMRAVASGPAQARSLLSGEKATLHTAAPLPLKEAARSRVFEFQSLTSPSELLLASHLPSPENAIPKTPAWCPINL